MNRKFYSLNKNYVLVQPISIDEIKSSGGILLQASHDDEGPNFGEVVAVGLSAAESFGGQLEEGCVVCYPQGVSTVVYLDPTKKQTKHVLLESRFIFGCVVLNEEKSSET